MVFHDHHHINPVIVPCIASTQVGGGKVGTTVSTLAIPTFSGPHPNDTHLFKRGTHLSKFTRCTQ